MTAMPAKLWEIGDELESLSALIAENGGELTPDIEARLDAIEGEFDAKAERIALLIRTHLVQSDAAKAEEVRLAAIRRSHESAADGLKRYLHGQMTRTGRTKVETTRARIRVQKNGQPSIRWTKDEAELPEAYRRVSVSVDLSLAREQVKAGDTLPDGFEIEHGTHLRIS